MRSLLTKVAGALVILASVILPLSAASSQTMDAVKERGSLRVGVTQAPPWFYKDPAGTEWTGLGASMGKDMAKKLGVEFDPVEVTWGTAVAALQANKIDVMFVLDATPERAKAINFPKSPLLYYSLAVLVDDDLTVENWSDLDSSEIKLAVTQGTSMDTYVTKQLKNAEILRFPSNGESVAAFQSGRVNAVSLFHPPLIAMRKQIGRGQIVVPAPAYQAQSSAGVRKEEDSQFVDFVDESIAEYYNSGTSQKWYEEFLTSFDVDPSSVPAIEKVAE